MLRKMHTKFQMFFNVCHFFHQIFVGVIDSGMGVCEDDTFNGTSFQDNIFIRCDLAFQNRSILWCF